MSTLVLVLARALTEGQPVWLLSGPTEGPDRVASRLYTGERSEVLKTIAEDIGESVPETWVLLPVRATTHGASSRGQLSLF